MPGVVTLQSRQRRMCDWMSSNIAYRFIAIGRTTAWPDGENNPPTPSEKTTEVEELIRFTKIRFLSVC